MTTTDLVKLTYEQVSEKHPELSQNMIWLLRNSLSSDVDFPIDQISWLYSYYFRREEIIFNKKLYQRILKMSVEERLIEELKYVDVSLCMVTPTFSILQRLKEIPNEVKEVYKKTVIQRMYVEQFFGFSINDDESSMEVSYPLKMDVWDEPDEKLSIDDLKEKLKEAIDSENYEEAAKIQKQIDSKS